MEVFGALLPFLLIGAVAAIVCRFTGIAISFLIAPALLALGARPIDLVAFILTFMVYNNFTEETQNARLDFKNLYLFGGKKRFIVLGIVLLLALFAPFTAVALFLLCFVMELTATLYFRMAPNKRPERRKLMSYGIVMSILTVIGTVLVHYIPSEYYFYLVGVAITLLTCFAYYAGQNRSAFYKSWLWIWSSFGLLLGLFGVEASVYLKSLRRTFPSKEDYMFGIVTMVSCLVGFTAIFVMDQIYSIPALLTAIGAGFGIRIVGVYDYNNRGGFSTIATILAVLVVLILLVAQPQATGFGPLEALYNMTTTPVK